MGTSFLWACFCTSSIIVLTFVNKSDGSLAANGANVCLRSQRYSQTYQQSYQTSWKRKSSTRCGWWGWGRCTVYRTVYGVAYKLAIRQGYKVAYYCCPGWKKQGRGCPVAICKDACVNGTCSQPDTCSCNAGFYGQTCARECPSHKWGPHCRHDCKCQNGAKCDSRTGACACTPGWQGQNCSKTCDQGSYGDKCQQHCLCSNGGTCDPVMGNCSCGPGYRGKHCKLECSQGWYGQDCRNRCGCRNGADCHHITGTCNCTAGWQGDLCSTKCPEGTYGYNCSLKCISCFNGAVCNHVNGTCTCAPGYRGHRCGDTCPSGTYGNFCAEECRCKNGTCSPVDGSCNCTIGYTGAYCDKPCSVGSAGLNCTKQCNCTVYGTCNQFTGKCQCQPGFYGDHCEMECKEGFFGSQCKGTCQCLNNATCDKKDGTCDCPPGWIGVHCDNPCPAVYYGKNCQSKCRCQNGGSCDRVDGSCTCVNVWQGQICDLLCDNWTYGVNCRNDCVCNQTQAERCHAITGKCFCKSGFTGIYCNQRINCPAGFYGNNCDKKCSCNGAPCDVATGVCDCPAGLMPPSCADKCPSGSYGYKCQEMCKCQNGALCDPVSGGCGCTAGWQGVFCGRGCANGWYGPGCNNSCDCLHGSSCHHVTGKCTCGAGWEGLRCNKSCDAGFYGYDCQSVCQCYKDNTVSCDYVDGHCFCEPGWTGQECTLFCPRRMFGPSCSEKCKCREASTENCDHVTGACTCLEGWIGDQCDKSCDAGYYGYKCKKECQCNLPNMDAECNVRNGLCYCEPGYITIYCNQTEPTAPTTNATTIEPTAHIFHETNLTITEEDTVILNCTMDYFDGEHVWSREDGTAVETTTRELTEDTQLEIKHASIPDAGVYICKNGKTSRHTATHKFIILVEVVVKVQMIIKVLNYEFTPELKNKSSEVYKATEANFTAEMNKVYNNTPGYVRTEVLNFTKGSVNVDFRVIIVIVASDPKNASTIPDKKAEAAHRVVVEAKDGLVKKLRVDPNVQVFSPPLDPRDVEIFGIKSDELSVRWKTPEDSEAFNILTYYVQYKKFYTSLYQNVSRKATKGKNSYSYIIKDLEDETTYLIRVGAENKIGANFNEAKAFETLPSPFASWIIVLIVLAILLVLGIIVGLIVCKRRRSEERRRRLEEELQYNRFGGLVGDVRMDAVSHYEDKNVKGVKFSYENESFKPSEVNWKEIPYEKLTLMNELGSGAFGVVYKGELKRENGDVTTCAVKSLKASATNEEIRDLYNELEIMTNVGDHPNLVNLLGACTQDGHLLVVLEIAENGNLLEYLKKSRESNQNYENINSGGLTEEIKIRIATDVAKGMSHLANCRCIHRDLAARNVLLADNYVSKVSDYGMARDVYEQLMYKKETQGKLPVKWMAIESLETYVFTMESDVWSFGVLLWEIESAGLKPYAGMNTTELMAELKKGYRLEKPAGCSDAMYEIMTDCWNANPKARPTFDQLVARLENMAVASNRSGQVLALLGGEALDEGCKSYC